MISKLVDWWLRRRGQIRIPSDYHLDVVPAKVLLLTKSALPLVEAVEKSDNSGEWKRHQVYAQLIKLYPEVRRRDLGWAIERAIRSL